MLNNRAETLNSLDLPKKKNIFFVFFCFGYFCGRGWSIEALQGCARRTPYTTSEECGLYGSQGEPRRRLAEDPFHRLMASFCFPPRRGRPRSSARGPADLVTGRKRIPPECVRHSAQMARRTLPPPRRSGVVPLSPSDIAHRVDAGQGPNLAYARQISGPQCEQYSRQIRRISSGLGPREWRARCSGRLHAQRTRFFQRACQHCAFPVRAGNFRAL